MSWSVFKDALMGATRLYCMIALILAGAAFLTLSMGYIGLPRHLAEWIDRRGGHRRRQPFLAQQHCGWTKHRWCGLGGQDRSSPG